MNGRHFVCALVSIAMSCGVGLPIAAAQSLSEESIRQAARPLVEEGDVDGLSIGFIDGERFGIVHLGSVNGGKASANFETIYELGSVSKLFTSLLLADAVVRGEVDLYGDAKVENAAGIRLPAQNGRSIRWLDLSTHRSGLPRLPSNLPLSNLVDPYRGYDSKQAAAFVNGYELPREPGKSQEYSNFGASMLGYLLAEKAGKSYDELLRERVAEPLKMTDCAVTLSSDQEQRLATPHSAVGAAASRWAFEDLPGAGGVHATMRDMMRFAKAQLNPPSGPIGEAIELAWKQHSEADDSGPATGLGWMIAGDGQTRWHNGRTGGFTSAIFINRQLNSAVIVLCNTSVDKVDALAIQLLRQSAGMAKGGLAKAGPRGSFAKRAPFSAIRWQDSAPEIQVGDAWFKLVSIDGVSVAELIAYSRRTYRDLWRKRFAEDLVEVMAGMGHEPGDTVRLVVTPVGSTTEQTFDQVAMTEANRWAIKQAARDGEDVEADADIEADAGDDKAGNAVIDAKFRRRLVGRYQLAPTFIFTVRDRDGHLMVSITDQPTQEVFPDSPTRWSYRGVDATLEFNLPKTGRARSLFLHQNGMQQTARRID